MKEIEHFDKVNQLEKVDPLSFSSPEELKTQLKQHKIAEDEYETLIGILKRQPTIAELGVFSAMWSEHCSYKSSKVHLGRFPTTGEQVVVGPGENAGVVRLSGKLCVAFKMESHNHPSYIEPYQGAATGVGGILRDVFCMGARPVANLNCLRYGEKSHPKTPWLLEHSVKGIGDYGNCMGIPTVGGNISFDASYNGNCLVNAMTAGFIHEDRIFKGYASGVGNLVIYVGSATGRDGIHGATMASNSFESSESSERGAIQVGDPFMEKLLLEATLEVLDKNLVIGIQDMGAAGLTSSSFEMAERAQSGLIMDLSRVPVRTTHMTAYELLLSESQERMLMVIKPENWEALAEVLEKWQLHYDIIGKVTDTKRMQIIFDNKIEVDVPIAPLVDSAPKYNKPMKTREYNDNDFEQRCLTKLKEANLEDTLKKLLSRSGSKKFIYEQYDHDIGGRTALDSTKEGASVIWARSEFQDPTEPYVGMLVSTACNESYCRLDPKNGASYAVIKSARMIAAAGGTPLATTDCLNYGNPDIPEVMWEFSQGVDGISKACTELNTPVVSGNVSLYNETDRQSIAPTPMIGMIGRITDVRKSVPSVISQDSDIFFLSPKEDSFHFSASLVAKVLGLSQTEGILPAPDYSAEKEAIKFMQDLSERSIAHASRDIGQGGLLTTSLKMSQTHNMSLTLSSKDSLTILLAEIQGGYLIAVSKNKEKEILKLAESLNENQLIKIGHVSKQENVEIRINDQVLSPSLYRSYNEALA